MNKKKNHINRRDFLKIMGAGTVTATAALYGCGNKNGSQNKNNLQTDGTMTYRRNPHGDDVSLLGYGWHGDGRPVKMPKERAMNSSRKPSTNWSTTPSHME